MLTYFRNDQTQISHGFILYGEPADCCINSELPFIVFCRNVLLCIHSISQDIRGNYHFSIPAVLVFWNSAGLEQLFSLLSQSVPLRSFNLHISYGNTKILCVSYIIHVVLGLEGEALVRTVMLWWIFNLSSVHNSRTKCFSSAALSTCCQDWRMCIPF
jgi:hypothetical protein